MNGWTLTHLETVDSTMDWLKRQSLQDRLAVISDIQTSGRGRRGGQWQSPKGNLYLSFCVAVTPELLEKLPFIVALCVADSLPAIKIQLKWPNDIWVGSKKLGGVLIERSGDFAVCGIGLNVIDAPDDATSLRALGHLIATTDLANKIFNTFDEWYMRKDWVDAWNKRAAFMSETVTFVHGGRDKTGVFEGIDKKGRAILLDHSVNMYHAYSAGELSKLRPQQ